MTETALTERHGKHSDSKQESSRGSASKHDAWSDAARDAYRKSYENPSPNGTDTNPQQKVTDFNGKACKTEIKPGQAPELVSGKPAKSCDFKDLKDGKLDMPSIYDQAQKSSFHIEVHGMTAKGPVGAAGSGVAVGKDGDKCYVATDDHVVGGAGGIKPEHIWAHQNNESFPAQKVWNDAKHDLALLKVDMSKHPELCQPAKIKDNPDMKGEVVGAGYPLGSNALTLSPGKYLGKGEARDVIGSEDPKERTQTDPKRIVYASTNHTKEGQSGGGYFNRDGSVSALVGGGFPGVTRFTSANPLNQKQIEHAIESNKR